MPEAPASTERGAYGFEEERSAYILRGVVGRPEVSAAGNVILRAGNQNEDLAKGWQQSVHVVLTPAEADDFVAAIVALRSGKRIVPDELVEAARDILNGGTHPGPCINAVGADPGQYDEWDTCHLHIDAHATRKRRLERALAGR